MSWGPATVFIQRRLNRDGSSLGPANLNLLPSDDVTYDEDLRNQSIDDIDVGGGSSGSGSGGAKNGHGHTAHDYSSKDSEDDDEGDDEDEEEEEEDEVLLFGVYACALVCFVHYLFLFFVVTSLTW